MLKSLSTKHIIVSHFAYCEISEMLELNNREPVGICTRIPDSRYI